MSDNLQYFIETSYKATGSDTLKVKIIITRLLQPFYLTICNVLTVI